jgi:HD superfamily phosphohydrolase
VITLEEYASIPAELGIEREDIVQIVYDRIYGPIPITRFAYALLMTFQLQRLKNVSHLGLLNGMTRLNVCASRLEHVIGVYYLILIVTRLPELRPFRNLLIAAALGHDNGSPPYSHSVEGAQILVMKRNHEGVLTLPCYANSEFAAVLDDWQISYAEFCQLVSGTHPNALLNALIHGQHDLDRCDGTCRYALTWHPVKRGLPYDPQVIAYAFAVDNGNFVLREPRDANPTLEIVMRDFLATRRDIFDWITNPIIEAPEVQLARAVTFAVREGKIRPEFFWKMDDTQATTFLTRKCNGATKVLVERVISDQHYQRVSVRRFFQPSDRQISLLMDYGSRQAFADRIAERLQLPPEDVCVNTGKFKGVVDMRNLPMFAQSGRPIVLPSSEPWWFAHTYLSPEHVEQHGNAVDVIMDELLAH